MEIEFGAWVKKRRRRLDLTQEDLAARALCSVNSIRKIERDELTPSKALAQELARALDLAPAAYADFVQFARQPNAVVAPDPFTHGAIAAAPVVSPETTAPPPLVVHQKFELPAPLTAAIGRDHDVAVVTRVLRLPSARLVTLTGAPGTGKTRLALEVATALTHADESVFEHGAVFVALAPISDATFLEAAIARQLHLPQSGSTSLSAALRSFLQNKQMLLVPDKFEHLPDAAPLVNDLLVQAPRLKFRSQVANRCACANFLRMKGDYSQARRLLQETIGDWRRGRIVRRQTGTRKRRWSGWGA